VRLPQRISAFLNIPDEDALLCASTIKPQNIIYAQQ
jgi:hypothetical protein